MWRTLGTLSIALGLVAIGGSASATERPQGDGRGEVVLADFRAALADAAAGGGVEAASELARFDGLGAADRTAIASYLLGESDLSAFEPSPGADVTREGDRVVADDGRARWIAESVEEIDPVGVRASTYSVHSRSDQTFKLAGITISKTRVWADYKTGSGVVKSVTDYGCQLVSSIDPFSSITTSKQSKALSSGKATVKCAVVVRRGVPTPWGQISTTTRSAYQYMRVNGSRIEAQGWS